MTSIKLELGSIQLNTHILKNTYTTVMQEYNNLRKELEEKYGKVSINVSDGSYEEIKEDEIVKKCSNKFKVIPKNRIKYFDEKILKLNNLSVVNSGFIQTYLMMYPYIPNQENCAAP